MVIQVVHILTLLLLRIPLEILELAKEKSHELERIVSRHGFAHSLNTIFVLYT
jgi:hypothetical protein